MKKKISFVLAAIMLVANLAISVVSADTNTTFTDVSNTTKYSKAILTMVKLGIVNGYAEDNTFRPEAGIKRSEFTAVITRAMGIANGGTGVSPFTDVAQDHWALKNIIAASSREIVNGMGDGTFHPEDNVTYEQALKMVVCALNYKNAAELAGGWAAGAYFNKAVELGLTKDVGPEAQKSTPAPRGVVAQIMYNALDIKVANAETGKETEDTFLNEFLNMGMAEGTVVGVEDDVTADCTVKLGLGQMAVKQKNGNIIVLDFYGFGDKALVLTYLGQEASMFYKISATGESDKLVILDSETSKNEEIEISCENIISYDSGSLKYFNESGRRTDVKIDEANVTVFYNKKAVTSNLANELKGWLNPSHEDFIYGSVVLKDSGSDGTFDMIQIMDYDYLVTTRAVSNTDFTATNKMKFKDKTKIARIIDSVELNPDTKSYSFTIEDQNGVAMDPTSIKANSVVMVAESKNGDMKTVKVSTKMVQGKITSYIKSENTIQIDGTEYRLTDDCITYFEDLGTPLDDAKKGQFYLDAFGNIAYGVLNADTDTTVLAYLITAAYMDDTDSLTLRVYVPGFGYKTYSVSKKVTLNGEPKGAEAIREELADNTLNFVGQDYNTSTPSPNEHPTHQLIKMEVVEGEVTEITSINAAESGTIDNSTGLKLYHSKPEKYTYNGSVFKSSNHEFFVSSSTIFIGIPEDRTATNAYSKRSTGWFKANNKEEYTLEPVNVKNKMAEIVLIYEKEADSKVEERTPISVLASPASTKNTTDGLVTRMFLLTNSATESEVLVESKFEGVANSLEVGDLFRYVKSSDGKATDIQKEILYSDIKSVLDGGIYDWSDDKFHFSSGTATATGATYYVEATIYNVIAKSDDKKSLYVTRDGFVDGKIPETNALYVAVDGAQYVKMETGKNDTKKIVSTKDTGEAISYDDIITANGPDWSDTKCSKIAVISLNSKSAKLVVIYE